MKATRVLIVTVLLLSVFTSTAGAASVSAGTDRAVGFVQMLSQVDARAPVAMQAQDAASRLMPYMLAAQKRGQVVAFEPSLSTGVMKIVYRPSMGLLKLPGWKVQSTMKAAIASANLPRRAPPSPQALSGPAQFSLYLYDNVVYASGLPANARVIGTLRDTTGRLVSVYDGYADSSGGIDSGYFSWAGPWADVVPGYKITFKVNNVSTYSTIVANIQFTSIDKTNSILNGKGTAGATITAYWEHRNWDSGNTVTFDTGGTTVAGTGAWSIDFGTVPIHGHDFISANLRQTITFTFFREMYVPYSYCQLGSNYCEVSGFAGTSASIQIVHGGITYSYAGKFNMWGLFSGELLKPDGSPIFLVPGDKVSATGVVQYALPALTAAINYTTDVVTGKAPASRYFNVGIYVPSTDKWYSVYTHSTSTGTYAANFASKLNLVSATPYVAEVYFVAPSTGNTTDFSQVYSP